MIRFQFNKDGAIAATLYVLNKLGRTDFHKLFKILYFAEQKHLAQYGKPITGDDYIAMTAGPVPSTIYDILKAVKFQREYPIDWREYHKFLNVEGNHFVVALQKAEQDFLSESQIAVLDESINDNKDLSFSQLKDKSHDLAWGNAESNFTISYSDLAECGGADNVMIAYLKIVSENQTAKLI
ncbi:MAG: Panacea domain-containing protein [Bacteroidota bacterium]